MKVFITGTGTGIGKTWVSAALAAEGLRRGESVVYYKPVQTGSPLNAPTLLAAWIASALDLPA